MFISKRRYNNLIGVISDQKNTIDNLNRLLDMQNRLIIKQRNVISGKLSGSDIDFPNAQKGGFESSNIFEL